MDLTCSLPEFELAVDLSVGAGITALFGASGSGKTTLLQLIAGVRHAKQGRIVWRDQVLFDSDQDICVPARDRRIGIVFQDLRLFPHLDVRGNLLFGHRTIPERGKDLQLDDVVAALDIAEMLDRRPEQLSGGERQRVALGRTLLTMPQLLLMDEPLTALDYKLRDRILPYLRWVHECLEIPVIYVSHSLPEILELTDQVVVLSKGKVTGEGEVFDVLGDVLRGDETVGTASVLPVEIVKISSAGDSVHGRVGEQEVVLPFDASASEGGRGRVALRPEDVMLARSPLQEVSARNQLRGRVVRISPLHGRLLVHLELAPDAVLRAELTRASLEDLAVSTGAEFYCVVKTSAFRWL
ncbi:MAG: molybdenum ABC transporter ATP-binding protein [Planctomycetota bacterium]|nr:molybdenum ABC transporter ATP-binding protein [Planctomycetota bacterium]